MRLILTAIIYNCGIGMKIAFEDEEIMKDEELDMIKDKQIDYLKMYKIVKDISKAMEAKANCVKNEVEKLIKKDYERITNVRVWGSLSQSAEPRVVIERIGENQKKVCRRYNHECKRLSFCCFLEERKISRIN